MMETISMWLYNNAAAIIISSLISLFISRLYYMKGNRDELLMTIIFPIVLLLEKRYTKANYEKLFDIKTNYAIRYLQKKERKALMLLIDQYKEICRYDKVSANTDCVLAYYSYKLEQAGVIVKPCPIYDEDGEVVAYDYPPEYFYFANYINELVSTLEYNDSLDDIELEKCFIKAFDEYSEKFYTRKKIGWFEDYTITGVIKNSKITHDWKNKFELMEQRKKEFLDLSISKKVINIMNEK